MLDHEGHELGGVAADAKELKLILFDKRLKCGMGGYANAVAVGIFQNLAKSNEGLDVTA